MTHQSILAFLEIIQCGSITKAAERLYISQPALSLRMRGLEDELGCKLFSRRKGSRNIELTSEGKEFVQIAARWNEIFDEMQSLRNYATTPTFRISALNSISTTILPEVFRSFLNHNTHVSLETEDLSSYAAYDSIEAKRIDFAIIVDCRHSVRAICRPLFSEKLKMVCNQKAQFSDVVEVSQLNPSNYIYCPWSLEFEQWNQRIFGKGFRPLLQVQIMQQLEYFLEHHISWSIIPASVEQQMINNPNIISRDLHGDLPERKVMYLTQEERYTSNSLTQVFIDCLRISLSNASRQKTLISYI